jgi:coenzyme F420-0:L-glutamate ligase / coenzyme F420-1:gamma-L-glutamate ligase
VQIVLSESREVLRAVRGVIVVEDARGLVLANAGVDRSNVDVDEAGRERVLLLPADPDRSASRLRQSLARRFGVDVGVLDRRGEKDLHGRELLITEVGFADELAAAASAVMGQADEGRPAVLVRGAALPRRDGTARELQRPRQKDLFR